jgi:pseudouridine kinase
VPPPVPPQVVCVGGAVRDRKLRSAGPLVPGTSNPVRSERSFGGVARNVAENLARLGVATALVSLVGDDGEGHAIRAHLGRAGVDTRFVAVADGQATAEYLAVLPPSGELAFGLAEMAIFDALTPARLAPARPALAAAAWVFADCNLPAATLLDLAARPRGARLAVDGVSAPKVLRLPRDLSGIDLLFLNLDEARAALGRADAEADAAAAALLARGAGAVVLTLGPDGLVAAGPAGLARVPAAGARRRDVTGAGDALVAATLAGLIAGRPLVEAARTGCLAAALTIESPHSVRPDIGPALRAAGRMP